MKVADPRALADIAHRNGLALIMDNTFLSPALLRPAELGADLTLHSATKYLSGNGQVQGGIVSGRRRLVEQIRDRMLRLGSAMSPFAAWMLLAGIHTLPLRIERHSENALRLASLLERHPAVSDVHYPGLASDPGHALAAELIGHDLRRFGGMFSFTLRDGSQSYRRFFQALDLCTIAVSLGDSSTLVWPWHTGDLIRVSVGLEDSDDLDREFAQALDAVALVSADA